MSVSFHFSCCDVLTGLVQNFSSVRTAFVAKLKNLKEAKRPGAPSGAPAPGVFTIYQVTATIKTDYSRARPENDGPQAE